MRAQLQAGEVLTDVQLTVSPAECFSFLCGCRRAGDFPARSRIFRTCLHKPHGQYSGVGAEQHCPISVTLHTCAGGPGSIPGPGHMGFVTEKVALGAGFLKVLGFPFQILFPLTAPHSLSILSLVLHSLDTDSLVKILNYITIFRVVYLHRPESFLRGY